MAICEWIFLLIFVTTLNIVQGSFDYVVGTVYPPLSHPPYWEITFSPFFIAIFAPILIPAPKKRR